MRMLVRWLALIGFATCVMGYVWTTMWPGSRASASSNSHTFLVNAGSGDEFTSAAPGTALAATLGADHLMTASQAVKALRAKDPAFSPPDGIAYHLGTLSQSSDDQSAVPPQTPVWALTWHACPLNASGAPLPPTDPCVEWLFLDAATGRMIVAEWQEASDSPTGHVAHPSSPAWRH